MTTTHTPGPPPTFIRGDSPYWWAACGCQAAATEWRYCPLHAAAPEMQDELEALAEWLHVIATSDTLQLAAVKIGAKSLNVKIRALLAKIEGKE